MKMLIVSAAIAALLAASAAQAEPVKLTDSQLAQTSAGSVSRGFVNIVFQQNIGVTPIVAVPIAVSVGGNAVSTANISNLLLQFNGR